MGWIYLSNDDWRSHRKNRFGGLMVGVLLWVTLQLVFAVLVILVLATDRETLFREEVPDAYDWLLWIAMAAGPIIILPALVLKKSFAPTLFAAYICVTFLLLLGAEYFGLDWFSAQRYETAAGTLQSVVFAVAVTVDVLVIRYLFTGARPNVIYRRRIPA